MMVKRKLKRIIRRTLNIALNRHFFQSLFPKLFSPFISIAKILDEGIALLLRFLIMKTTKIDNNKILLLCFQGDYCCNPKGIVAEIIKRKEDFPYKVYWRVNKKYNKRQYPRRLRLVKTQSYAYYKALASAKVIIDNTLNLQREHLRKKRGQYLIQTWHGSLGIKRLDGDVVMNAKWKRFARLCSKDTDFCISNSTFETKVFHTSYWKNVPILLYGHARNDILFSQDEEKLRLIREKINKRYGITNDTKIFMFAPTHRDNKNEHLIDVDFDALHNVLVERFGGEWIIFVRLHSILKSKSKKWLEYISDYVINVTMYKDIQELILITDIGMTDYSSWIFDFMLRKKPGFIFFDDLLEFNNYRGFYYPLETTPFPIARNNEELAEKIMAFDEEKYMKDCEQFLIDRGCIEDGHASERIIDKIKELMISY